MTDFCQQSVWHYGGGKLEQSASFRCRAVVLAESKLLSFSFIHQHLITNLASDARRKKCYCRHNAKPFKVACNFFGHP